ncbi:unnamed protein product [marine sediment metagenome]|uniref:Glycosyltransferase subfamily 4-like N-terminal domain-containing protein n=1 Tax=marine sediment metagenome TaxID=412755 RepID=X1BPH8_9ZZZZ
MRDYTFRSKYVDEKMTEIFEKYFQKINPDIVHIGHLSHLTVLIVKIIKKYKIPILFTLHDFWMICIRGQLIKEDLSLCNGPSVEKCAKCNIKYFTSFEQAKKEIINWLNLLKEINEQIDLFIASSQFLREKYIEYGIPENKIIFMDYGFNLTLFKKIKRNTSKKIRFFFPDNLISFLSSSSIITYPSGSSITRLICLNDLIFRSINNFIRASIVRVFPLSFFP